MMKQNYARAAAVRALKAKGYTVIDVSKGQGVPKLSRLSIKKKGDAKTKLCVVKYSTGGRISFLRNDQGNFTVLPDMDFVLYARPVFDGSDSVKVTFFDNETVARAFEANLAALKNHGMSHIPSWVNPDPENGWRLTGSGFGKDAIWSEVVSLMEGINEHPPSKAETGDGSEGITIGEAKQRLAITFGVSIDAVEITIRG